jgi:hypothetical protein
MEGGVFHHFTLGAGKNFCGNARLGISGWPIRILLNVESPGVRSVPEKGDLWITAVAHLPSKICRK